MNFLQVVVFALLYQASSQIINKCIGDLSRKYGLHIPHQVTPRKQFLCTDTGNFANPQDVMCKSYFNCYKITEEIFLRKHFLCYGGLLFNPRTRKCDRRYDCHLQQQNLYNKTSSKINNYIRCIKEGSFQNSKDTTCKSYYHCYKWSNGFSKQFKYTCNSGWFNPHRKICDKRYKCPNHAKTIKTTSSALASISNSINYNASSDYLHGSTKHPTNTFVYEQTSDQKGINTNLQIPASTKSRTHTFVYETTADLKGITTEINFHTRTDYATNIFMYDQTSDLQGTTTEVSYNRSRSKTEPEYLFESTSNTQTSEDTSTTAAVTTTGFKCSKTGNFANSADKTCKSYFYCYVWPNGTIGQYLYPCTVGLFNPEISNCDVNFVCPSQQTTEFSTEITSITATSTESFQCSETGYFPNPADKACKSYFYCYVWPNGTIGRYLYPCTVGLFNPEIGNCDVNFVCPSQKTTQCSTEITSTTDATSTESFQCSETGYFPNSADKACKSYFYCYVWPNGTIGQYLYPCTVGLFNPEISNCDVNFVCPSQQTTEFSTEITSTTDATSTESFQCSETGYFPNPADKACKSYFYCYVWPNGTIGQYLYPCTVGLFNPEIGNCDVNFVCPSQQTTEFSTEITSITATSTESFQCSETGYFPNPADKACKSYFYCYVWPNGTIGQYLYPCTVGLFNPEIGNCDVNFVCPSQKTTQFSTEITSTTDATSTESFQCSETGYFPNSADKACKSYFYCYVWPNGTIGQYLYPCTVGLFNPEISNCDVNFVCPSQQTTEFSTEITSTTDATSTESFQCSETGYFPNPADKACKSYFYCYVWPNGTIGQYLYPCTVGLFNPEIGNCDVNFVCPSQQTTQFSTEITSTTDATSTESFQCSETGYFPNPADKACKSYFYCYVWPNGTIGQYLYPCTVGLFNPKIGNCDVNFVCPSQKTTQFSTEITSTTDATSTESFQCSETGYFPNSAVKACKSYFYCYVWPNGTIGQYLYPCTVGLFNPEISNCDVNFVCPSQQTTEFSTEITSTTDATSTESFQCSETGYFPNPADKTCKSYFYCYVWPNGTIGQYLYPCTVGLFNPEIGNCDVNFVCPSQQTTQFSTEITSTTDATSTESFQCSETGYFPNSADKACKSYFYCYVWPNGTIGQYLYPCTVGLFNPEISNCDVNFVCPSQQTTEFSTEITSITDATSTESFQCSETGYFPNPADKACKSYFYCYVWPNGTIGQYLYPCTVGLFNPEIGNCDVNFVCPSQQTTQFSTEITLTTDATSTESFQCSETGYFPNPADKTCKSYFYCYVWPNGTIGQYLYPCTVGLFNPEISNCDVNFVCPSQQTTEFSTEITSITDATSTESFQCSETGYFPNPADKACKSYFYCYVWPNGTIGQYLYPCTVGLFNPKIGNCDVNFVCPSQQTTQFSTEITSTTDATSTESFQCSETGYFPNPADKACKSYFYCYVWPNGTIGQYLYPCTVGLFNPKIGNCDVNFVCPSQKTTQFSTEITSTTDATSTESFQCSETGYFPNSAVKACKSYFYCYVWPNGTIGQYLYPCTVGLFNPEISNCDVNFVCPSQQTTEFSTEITSTTDATSTESFQCSETGYFSNPADKACKSYFYCYVWPNGTIGQYLYPCTVGLFNPEIGNCDVNFVCPSQQTTQFSTEITSTTDATSTESFQCSETGYFPNSADKTCKSYFYCYVWPNGTIGRYLYPCTVGLFNPEIGNCDVNFVCPLQQTTEFSTEITSTTDATSTESFQCSETGYFPNSADKACKSYFYCYVWRNGTIGQYLYPCTVGLFNPEIGNCDVNFVCPSQQTTQFFTEITSITATNTESFQCSETGYFPNSADKACKSYFYCYVWPNGTIGQYLYPCTVGLFNPKIGNCDVNFVCPSQKTTQFSTEITSTTDATSTESFQCSETGYFPNPADKACKSYFYCYVWPNGTIGQYLYPCTVGLFNPEIGNCDVNFVCPSQQTIQFSAEITSTTDATSTESFQCSETGYFPNPADKTCKSYFYCYVWPNGTIGQYLYPCTVGLFNPEIGNCDVNFVCPSQQTTQFSTEITSTTDVTSSESFQCSETGYFPNSADKACKSYFYCYVWPNGTIGQYLYPCTVGLFNPKLGNCDVNFVCPSQ